MKNINSIPGYKVNEYLLVLNPHEDLRNKIMQVKKHFFDTYKAASAVYSKPHITLVNFVQYQMMEERLLNRLKIIAMGYHPIKVELKDYESFPAHTIYINVTSKLPIQNLIKQIRSEAQQLMHLNKEHRAHFILEPFVTIARKLQPWQFEKGWLEYSNKQFTGRFIADAMLLLKRPVGQIKYEIVQRFEFKNLPVTTTQGALFG
ncbi:MAG: 2'-5' RNA ligase family protein [Ferruginibacter sp.]|nr:2'-5' RNA ligase family protein [Ferruginibacter sp.]